MYAGCGMGVDWVLRLEGMEEGGKKRKAGTYIKSDLTCGLILSSFLGQAAVLFVRLKQYACLDSMRETC